MMGDFVRPVRTVTVLVAVVAGAGCGGSSTAPSEATRLTQASFALKANYLCRTYGRQIKGIGKRINAKLKRRNFEAAVLALEEARRPYRTLLFQLSLLRPPLRQERRFRQLIRLGNKEQAYLHGVYVTLSTYDFAQARTLLSRLNRVGRRSDALSRSLGLRICAS
ncbi:MAG: hypothetical protein M3O73_07040 [Actinomycetota bacterium]|nr:hypothetical protein [Actinomycetota bacterium]